MGMTREEKEAAIALEKLKNNKNYLVDGKMSQEDEEQMRREFLEYKNNLAREQNRTTFIYTVIFAILFIILFGYLGINFYKTYLRKVEISPAIDKSSDVYTNNIYTSNKYLYEKNLLPVERDIYLGLIKHINNMDSHYYVDQKLVKSMSIPNITFAYYKAGAVVERENPELFYYKALSVVRDGKRLRVDLTYTVPFRFMMILQRNKIERKIDDIVKGFDKSGDLIKIKQVYDYFANNKTVDINNFNDNNVMSALFKKDTSCRSVALASQILFQRLGINSHVAFGMLNDRSREFNIIKLKDGYYYFDACYGIEVKSENEQYDYQAGMLVFNTDDYETGMTSLANNELGKIYKYKKIRE